MRRRNAMLEALELLREVYPAFTVGQLIALLHIADEQAPLPLPDLSRRADMSRHAAWKAVAALDASRAGQGLVQVRRWTMAPIMAGELTPKGERLCAALDAIIAEAVTIGP
ncbi:hypothetical protein [Phenylobacterium aquaticum]|uniref:hypothetical protein n=1 Tax=Phenylobacterium aquaticum TaxID=1763816 RepID=UPI001F5D299D|nr:hypothetical protein [Phenylobacterium aquaticum]MCI3132157.1 hypothetical protein [Phenylobacterium aquaticum]